jgi:two-component system cell cycle sensor histidine kinase/response regulator CckA
VTDTGCGISPDVAQRVLDPFFTTKFTGRGLGLAAVQGIVRSHCGTLSLHSALGKGTTFRVLLPVDRPTLSETPVQRTPPASVRGRVLIVDDEYAIRLFMERSLTMAGFQVHGAGDGFAAIEYFAGHAAEIDLVILDMMMPRMGGREVAERLVEYRPDVKLILMSGYSEGDVQQQFADLPLVAVLNKPFNPKRLIEIVRESLGIQVAVSK